MMRYLFDTDMLTLYEEGHPEVCRNVAAHHPDDLGTTIISVEEQRPPACILLPQAGFCL